MIPIFRATLAQAMAVSDALFAWGRLDRPRPAP
jgi:hypothetical protein